MKWEYKSITFQILPGGVLLTNALNEHGQECWELVQCDSGDLMETICIFKRPIPFSIGPFYSMSWSE